MAATSATPQPVPATSNVEPKWTRMPIRARPHRNPLADNDDWHPDSPMVVRDASLPHFYPKLCADGNPARRNVEFADIGCAFGGMFCALAPLFPDTLMLGLEIRPKVVAFAQGKTRELRENADPAVGHHHYDNVWFEQCNVMKHGCRFFSKGQLTKLFFAHPDPHFKVANLRRRIISPGLVHTYAYWVREGGLVYTVTDVPDLEEWMVQCLDNCPLFERLTEEEAAADATVLEIAKTTSEDAERAKRKGLPPNFAIHRRVALGAKKKPAQ
jgi:tRNA (guanine-N7-)-methyltransferase